MLHFYWSWGEACLKQSGRMEFLHQLLPTRPECCSMNEKSVAMLLFFADERSMIRMFDLKMNHVAISLLRAPDKKKLMSKLQ